MQLWGAELKDLLRVGGRQQWDPAFAPAGTPSHGRARIHVQHQSEGQWFEVWMDFLGFGSPSAGRGALQALPLLCHPDAGQGVKPHGPTIPFPFHRGDF